MGLMEEKRYALFLAAKDSDYVLKVYGGYFNVFVAAFGEEGERWDLFRVVEGDFPDFNELHKYDGFVISGSPYDAYGNDNWILKLCFMLQTLDAMQKKVLGICFGHQVNIFFINYHGIILEVSGLYLTLTSLFFFLIEILFYQVLCRALGGKVGKAYTGWDIGLRRVRIVNDLAPCSFLEDLGEIPGSLSIMECHRDEVWKVPIGAEVIGFSDKTGVEMFTIGDHILGIQGHPEYTKDILYNLIDRLLNNNSIEVTG